MVSAGIYLPALTAEQSRPCDKPNVFIGESAKTALARVGGQLIVCGDEKADVVATYDGVRHGFGGPR